MATIDKDIKLSEIEANYHDNHMQAKNTTMSRLKETIAHL